MAHPRRIALLLCGQFHLRANGICHDEALARLADVQFGVVARRQLISLGLSQRAIEHLATAMWIPLRATWAQLRYEPDALDADLRPLLSAVATLGDARGPASPRGGQRPRVAEARGGASPSAS